jgi:WD40 repeat protein
VKDFPQTNKKKLTLESTPHSRPLKLPQGGERLGKTEPQLVDSFLRMTHCLNASCPKTTDNPKGTKLCLSCGSKLLLNDRYRAIELLNEGGFGKTFLAVEEKRHSRSCAIFQLLLAPQILGNAEAMAKAAELFEQEARRLQVLADQHPQIASVFGYFQQDRSLYLVRQFIEGQDLWQELEEHGAFSEEQIRDLLADLLPVLQFAHERNVIHRHIKPTNIVRRSADRRLVLIDFAFPQQLTCHFTRTGAKVCSEGYAPIELIRGGFAPPASDLYSLGVTCIHLLTQASLEELFDPLEGRWVWREPLRKVGRSVSAQLGLVLDRMLKESVKERYQSATEVLADLTAVLSRRQSAAPAVAHLKPTTLPPVTPVIVTPASKLLHRGASQQAPKTWKCSHTLTGHSRSVMSVSLSPDGRLLASGSADKTVKLWNTGTGEHLLTLTGHTDDVNCVAFSPDGRVLASAGLDRTVKLWQVSVGKLLLTLTGHSDWVLSVAINPRFPLLASGSWDKTVKLWHLATGKLLHTLIGHSGGVRSVAFSPDGQTLASGSWDKTVKLWQLGTGKLLHTLTGHTEPVSSVAFSPCATTIASGSEDKTVKLWQPDTGGLTSGAALLNTLTDHAKWVNAIAFHPRSPILASGSRDQTIKLWHLPTGKLLHTICEDSYSVNSVAFSPDGQILASGSEDKTVKICRTVGPGL